MIPEEIRAIIREELAVVRGELAGVETRLTAKQDRGVEGVAAEISTMRQGLMTYDRRRA